MATFNKKFVALTGTNAPQALAAVSTVFNKLWIYPGTAPNAAGAGGLVANAQTIWVGKTATEQPDPLAPTATVNGVTVNGFPIVYETQTNVVYGQGFPFDLLNIYITGTTADGVYIVWT